MAGVAAGSGGNSTSLIGGGVVDRRMGIGHEGVVGGAGFEGGMYLSTWDVLGGAAA